MPIEEKREDGIVDTFGPLRRPQVEKPDGGGLEEMVAASKLRGARASADLASLRAAARVSFDTSSFCSFLLASRSHIWVTRWSQSYSLLLYNVHA